MSEKPKRRWFQFRLKAVLVVTTLACVALGWLAYERDKVQKRADAIAAIEKLGGKVEYDDEQPFRPKWLRPLLGDKSAGEVVAVNFFNAKIVDGDLGNLTNFSKLDWLVINHTQVTDSGLAQLANLTELAHLDLEHSKITDAGLVHLQGLTKLDTLLLSKTQVTGAGLVHLKGLPKLRFLYLDGTQITDGEMANLAGMTELEWLSLSDTKITDAGVEHLAGLTTLKQLNLSSTQVTGAGLVHLVGLTKLDCVVFPTDDQASYRVFSKFWNAHLERRKQLRSTPARILEPKKTPMDGGDATTLAPQPLHRVTP